MVNIKEKLSEVWNEDSSYITEFMLKKTNGIFISEKTLNELKDPLTIKMKKYCYKGYIDEFLSNDLQTWLPIMKDYCNNKGDFPERGISVAYPMCILV